MSQPPPSDGSLVPFSLQAPAQQAARLTAAFAVSDWTALQTYQAFLANAGIPFPLAIAPPGLLMPHGLPAYPTQLLSQQYMPPPPPVPPSLRLPLVDVTHTVVTDSSRQCMCNVCQKTAGDAGAAPPAPVPQEASQAFAQQCVVAKALTCAHCLCRFSHQAFLETHMRSHHIHAVDPEAADHGESLRDNSQASDSSNSFSCLFCDLKFPLKKAREIHMLAHTSERPYACNVCPWAFTDKWKLAAHQRTHTGLRPYTCPRCNESFSQKPTLTRHLRTHTGERPYLCRHCPATFLDSKNLSRHTRVHVGKRGPYACSDCNASFNRKQMLTAHRRVHNGAVSGCLSVGAELAKANAL